MRYWLTTIMAAALVAGGLLLAAPAHTVPACEGVVPEKDTNPDCFFLFMMKKNNITHPKGPDGLIAAAHSACDEMDAMAATYGSSLCWP